MPNTKIHSDFSRNDGFSRDIVGIGALNLDYIMQTSVTVDDIGSAESLVNTVSKLLTELNPPVQWNTERTVSEQEIELALATMPPAAAVALGGSAFNAIHALSCMQLGLRLGYVGVAGRIPPDAPSFLHRFDVLGVDRSFVRHLNSRCSGICLSIMESGEPTMLTHAGANTEMAYFLSTNFDEIVAYLASARVVHITSFLDSSTPQQLLQTLRAVKKRSPRTLISVDPGYAWCMEPAPAIKAILALSDFLSVNELELHELAHGCPSPIDDECAAHWVLQQLMKPDGLLLVKNPTGVRCYHLRQGEVSMDRHSHVPLAGIEIVDATGAGDVFIGGFLAGVVTDHHRLTPGTLLGMRLAKLHLQHLGDHALKHFADIARGFKNGY